MKLGGGAMVKEDCRCVGGGIIPPFVGLCCDHVGVFGVVAADQFMEDEVLLGARLRDGEAKLWLEACRAEGCRGALKCDAGVSAAKELLRSGVTVLVAGWREFNREAWAGAALDQDEREEA
jgi:hypothetical protein